MENKCSHPPKIAVNLNQLPPIDPLRIVNSSFNVINLISSPFKKNQLGMCKFCFFLIFFPTPLLQGKLNNSSTRVSAKVEKPRYNQRTKLVGSDEGVVVGDASSISSNCGNRTSTTQTLTDEHGKEQHCAVFLSLF